MAQSSHVEKHFTASLLVRDAVIGMSDGLTVPFALAAGLSGAVDSNAIIVTAGMAEIAAGSIAMGLGGYMAGRSDAEHYAREHGREAMEIAQKPEAEEREVAEIFHGYGLTDEEIAPVLKGLKDRPGAWVDFMMRFELGLEKPDDHRARASALTISGAYLLGGLIPLLPYMTFVEPVDALIASSGLTLTALLVFGWVKGRFTTARPGRSALQTVAIGGLAAGAAYLIARLMS